MVEENVVADNSNTAEEVGLDTTQETAPGGTVDVESLKAKLLKAEQLAFNQKVRAEKAEKLVKSTQKIDTPSLSTTDAIALIGANIKEGEDIEEVENWAKYKGISIAQALKSDELKAVLGIKAEKRGSAQATNTGSARHSPSNLTEGQILQRAKEGREIPNSKEDMDKLVKAVIDARRSRK
jgi:hypothetical protein